MIIFYSAGGRDLFPALYYKGSQDFSFNVRPYTKMAEPPYRQIMDTA